MFLIFVLQVIQIKGEDQGLVNAADQVLVKTERQELVKGEDQELVNGEGQGENNVVNCVGLQGNSNETEQLQKFMKTLGRGYDVGITKLVDLGSVQHRRLEVLFNKLNSVLIPTDNPFSQYARIKKEGLLEIGFRVKSEVQAVLARKNNNEQPRACAETLPSEPLSIGSIAKKIGINNVWSIEDLKSITQGELKGLGNLLETLVRRDSYFLKNLAQKEKDRKDLTSDITFYNELLLAVKNEQYRRSESRESAEESVDTDKEDVSDDDDDELPLRDQLAKYFKKKKNLSLLALSLSKKSP